MSADAPETLTPPCPVCNGFGVLETPDGRGVVPCGCRQERIVSSRRRSALIPERYGNCRLANFNVVSRNATLARAKAWAQRFVEEYPAVDRGLLLTGPVGVGKTHLAAAVLSELVEQKGARGLFCDFTDLLEKVQATFARGGDASADEVLEPYRDADLLVLDELGARRPTDWARDVLYGLLNTRYNRRRLTILTTNYGDAPGRPGEETLELRVGSAVRSRLYEMCEHVAIAAEDYRKLVHQRSAFS